MTQLTFSNLRSKLSNCDKDRTVFTSHRLRLAPESNRTIEPTVTAVGKDKMHATILKHTAI
eukprot:153036-Amphidinium_carterae.1